ncbi:MAG TPA: hypothetical protein VD884_16780 [Ohtaekwangia sp.]|nr:hypothetical protein [Ohtaekwangia sp.]
MENLTRIHGLLVIAETPAACAPRGYRRCESGSVIRRADKNSKSISDDIQRAIVTVLEPEEGLMHKFQHPVETSGSQRGESSTGLLKYLESSQKGYRPFSERPVLAGQRYHGKATWGNDLVSGLVLSDAVSTDFNLPSSATGPLEFIRNRNNTPTWVSYGWEESNTSYPVLYAFDKYSYRCITPQKHKSYEKLGPTNNDKIDCSRTPNLDEENISFLIEATCDEQNKNISDGRSFRIVWVKTDHPEGVGVAYFDQVIWYFKTPRLSFTT